MLGFAMKSCTNFLLAALVAATCLLTTGCHTVSPATVTDAKQLLGKKQVFLVLSPRKDRGFRKEIERNLTARGFTVTVGKREEMGAVAELFLEYDDRWAWDMVMYPSQVKIAIYNAATRTLIGSAEFKNSVFHTYADPPEITDELIGRIFGEPEGRYIK